LDCMVYLQAAARAQGPARACLEMVQAQRVRLFVSPTIMAELADVLTRPKVRRKFPNLTTEAVAAFLQDVERLATMIASVPEIAAIPRDSKDEPYLNLALASGAAYLVTRDKDLLELMDDTRPVGKHFRAAFPQLTILGPVDFLRILEDAK
jgi:putative PIN family toxin of toxin-antitoxin system